MRFELTRVNPKGLAVHRLNHSATSTLNNQNLYLYWYLKMSLSLQKLNDYETGSTKFVALWQANLFFSSIQTQTWKKWLSNS